MVARLERVRRAVIEMFNGLVRLPDRILRRRRRATAVQRLRALGRIERILVVCSGNICRSPYLAAVLRRELPSTRIASAGFVGFNWPVPEHSLTVAARRGIDLSEFRSQSVEPRRARTADLVIVMEPRQATYLASYFGVARRRIIVAGDLDPVGTPSRAIEDPYQGEIEAFNASFDRLDRCAAALCRTLQSDQSLSPQSTARAKRMGAAPDRLPQPVL